MKKSASEQPNTDSAAIKNDIESGTKKTGKPKQTKIIDAAEPVAEKNSADKKKTAKLLDFVFRQGIKRVEDHKRKLSLGS